MKDPLGLLTSIIIFQEYDLSIHPSEMNFKLVALWIRVYDLPIGGINVRVAERVRELTGGFIKADVDEKGRAQGPYLGIRV